VADEFAATTARLEELLNQAMEETDWKKADEISAEIRRIIEERDRLRRRPPSDPEED